MEGEQHGDRFRDRKRDKDTWIEKGSVRVRSRDNEKPDIQTHRNERYDTEKWTEDESQTKGEMKKTFSRLVTFWAALQGHQGGWAGEMCPGHSSDLSTQEPPEAC